MIRGSPELVRGAELRRVIDSREEAGLRNTFGVEDFCCDPLLGNDGVGVAVIRGAAERLAPWDFETLGSDIDFGADRPEIVDCPLLLRWLDELLEPLAIEPPEFSLIEG